MTEEGRSQVKQLLECLLKALLNLPIALKNALEIQDEDSLYCFAPKY
jgi:hypothetical protein